MAFTDAVQWWEEWQMRILVLASLFLQYFLYITAVLRKHCSSALFKSIAWLAYLGSDAIAIYALATLFNRHKKQEWVSEHSSSAALELLWAPILLLHLGGQDGFNAYSIEDNELWRRHFLTAASQITVAIYVFRKSWSHGEKRLLQAAILLFIPGILKCLEKPFALRKASISNMRMTLSSRVEDVSEDEDKEMVNSLDKYLEKLGDYLNKVENEREIPYDHTVEDSPIRLFVDLPYPYSIRLKNVKYMLQHGAEAHRLVRSGISWTFDYFYTKYKYCFGAVVRVVLVLLTFAAIRLFHMTHRGAYNDTDIKVTYALLCCSAILECISVITLVRFRGMSRPPWPEQVAQCNLIEYLARNARNKHMRRFASLLGCKVLVDQLLGMAPCRAPSSRRITELVHNHISGQWKEHIKKADNYHMFNDSRGQWTALKIKECDGKKFLKSSLQRPFDESVILWHLATEFCFYDRVGAGGVDAQLSREISNYMVYLLFMNPEMLMPGARTRIFRIAYGQLKKVLEVDTKEHSEIDSRKKMSLGRKEEIARRIIQIMKTNGSSTNQLTDVEQNMKAQTTGSELVHQAWDLAQELMDLGKNDADQKKNKLVEELMELGKNDSDTEEEKKKLTQELMNLGKNDGDGKKTWRVIEGVWVEMLCFSASRCRGYFHVKSLGMGGEYLTYIWLLREYMGMENLAQRMQRTELPGEGDLGAAGVAKGG